MTDEPTKAMNGSCLGGLVGAGLGVVIGWFVVPMILPASNGPFRVFDPCIGFVAALVGAGLGGTVGGIGGSVLGTGLAARRSCPRKIEPPSEMHATPVASVEPPIESPDAELARLKERIAELEGKQQESDRPKGE